jgi:antitoxin component YwqK of YwqJK toxin-antitoxin module
MHSNKPIITIIVISFLALFFFLYGQSIINGLKNKTSTPVGKLVSGKKEGEWKIYYATGQLKEIRHYKNDTLNGQSIEYFPNGNLSSKATYKNGILIDSFFMYYSNGQVNLLEWLDSNGHEQNLFKVYYENGQLSQIGTNKDGLLDDTNKIFYKNGKLKTIEFYRNKKKNGIWTYFDETGKQIKEESYKNDSLISSINNKAKQSSNKLVIADGITILLNKALKKDTLEYYNWQSFLYFKSGYFLDKKKKNAIVIYCSTDTTYLVQLYSIKNNEWKLTDSINQLDAFTPHFNIDYKDFNFDKQTDIYIQVSASNGWSLSRGNLLTLDPLTKKFIMHNEARDLANMNPDRKTKTVTSELWRGYNLQGQHKLTIFTNKWINGKLKTVRKKDVIVNS